MRKVYLCDDSMEGIFTAVYRAYAEKNGHRNNEIQIKKEGFNYQLFCEYIPVETDLEWAIKVARTIKREISPRAYQFICKVSASYREEKADAIYRFIIEGLHVGRRALEHLTAPHMQILCDIEKNINNEILRFIDFLRFEELENGVLFGRINPKSALLPFLADHFEDRFMNENWVIADTIHRTILIHEQQKTTNYIRLEEVDFEQLDLVYSDDEEDMQKLWKSFVDTIAIKERVNPKLQRQMLPLRFRKFMKEFDEG